MECKMYKADGGREAFLFETSRWVRVNASEDLFRDFGFQSVTDAEKWLEEHGYQPEE